jgi:hypothetical protein
MEAASPMAAPHSDREDCRSGAACFPVVMRVAELQDHAALLHEKAVVCEQR